MKLQELAQKLDCRLEGDPSNETTGVVGIARRKPTAATVTAVQPRLFNE